MPHVQRPPFVSDPPTHTHSNRSITLSPSPSPSLPSPPSLYLLPYLAASLPLSLRPSRLPSPPPFGGGGGVHAPPEVHVRFAQTHHANSDSDPAGYLTRIRPVGRGRGGGFMCCLHELVARSSGRNRRIWVHMRPRRTRRAREIARAEPADPGADHFKCVRCVLNASDAF